MLGRGVFNERFVLGGAVLGRLCWWGCTELFVLKTGRSICTGGSMLGCLC